MYESGGWTAANAACLYYQKAFHYVRLFVVYVAKTAAVNTFKNDACPMR
jgi:hypothetical protein